MTDRKFPPPLNWIAGSWQRLRELAVVHPVELLAAGAVQALAMPRFWWWPLGFLSMGWFLWRTRRLPPKNGFYAGWWYGFGAIGAAIPWIDYVVHVFGGLPRPLSLGPWALLSLYCALWSGVALWAAKRIARRFGSPGGAIHSQFWWFALTYAAAEAVRARLMTGIPWASFGYAVASQKLLLQAADLAGVFGLAALAILVLAGPLSAASGGPRARRGRMLAASAVIVVTWCGYGVWRQADIASIRPERTLQIGVVQGNVDQWQKWDIQYRDATIEKYFAYSRELMAADRLDLMVWPETAMPFYFGTRSAARDRVVGFAQEISTAILFGAPATVLKKNADGETVRQYRNRAYMVDEIGRTVAYVDKRHLVPFGEYVPMPKVLFFLEKFVTGLGNFSPGDELAVIGWPRATLGVLICFDVLFGHQVRELADAGAEVLLEMSNDAWFGETSAQPQQLQFAQVRAVENRRPLVRATNTGISGWIDAEGTIFRETRLNDTVAFRDTIPLRPIRSVYSAYADIIEWSWIVAAGLILAFTFIKKNDRND